MGQLDPGPTRAYPSIPHVGDDLASHKRAIEAIVEAIRIHERRTKNIDDSFVRVRDLSDLEITTIEYQITSPAPVNGADIVAGTVTDTQLAADSVTSVQLADSSVDIDSIIDGAVSITKFANGIEPVSIVSSLPALPDANYPSGAVVVLTTDGLLYRNDSGSWVKVVRSPDLDGTIDLGTQISGTLTAAFAEAGLINSNVTINADGTLSGAGGGQVTLNSLTGDLVLGQFPTGLRPVYVESTLPTLPDANYPNDSVVVLTTDGLLYRNNSGTWTKVVNTTDIEGTINLGSQVSGTLTSAFAEAGLINSNVTINADGSLSGAGGGQASLNSLPGTIQLASYAATQRPVIIVGTLPTLPDSNYPIGSTVVLTTDGKLYRNDSNVWTAAVPTTDLSGTVSLDTQVSGTLSTSFAEAGLINSNVTINADGTLSGAGAGQASLASLPGQISAGQIVSNTITAGQIAALTITAAEIAASTITGAKIAANTIEAGNIAAGTITATEIATDTITAGNIAAGAISTSELAADAVTASKLAIVSTSGALNTDPYTSDVTAWVNTAGSNWEIASVTDGKVGTTVIRSNGSTGNAGFVDKNRIPIDPTKTYRLHAWVRRVSGDRGVYLTAAFKDGSGATVTTPTTGWTGSGTYNYWQLVNANTTTLPADSVWREYTFTFGPNETASAPTGAVTLQIGGIFNYSTIGSVDNVVEAQDFRIEEVMPGTLIQDGVITTDKIAANAVTAAKIAALTITAAEIAANTITASQIAANTITASEIAAGTITATEIATDTITAGQIAAGAIGTDELSANAVTAAKIAANTITAAEIAALTITAAEIAASTITGAKIAANTIEAGNIAAGTITATEIATNTITAGQIAAGAINTDELAANAVTAAKLAASITYTGTLIISTSGHIRGGQTAYNTGSGFFLGYDTSTYKFSIGDGSTNSLTWDGTTLTVQGQLVVGSLTQSTTQFYLSADTARTEATNDTGADNFIEYKRFQVGAGGTIYMRWEDLRATYAGTLVNSGKVRWKKNGSVQNTQTVSNTTYTQRSFSGTVNAGDIITVEISGGTNNDGGEWFGFGITIRNARIGAILTLTADGSVITD